MGEGRASLALGAAVVTFAVGALVATALSPTTGTPTPNVIGPPIPIADDYATDWHVQTAIASYQGRLLRSAQRDTTFAGARFAFDHGVFLLYGAGRPSSALRTMIDAAPDAVSVRWIRVPYSAADLDAARRILRREMPEASVVEFAPNYGGILVGLRPLPQSASALESLYARAQRLTDVPVTFLQTGSADPQRQRHRLHLMWMRWSAAIASGRD